MLLWFHLLESIGRTTKLAGTREKAGSWSEVFNTAVAPAAKVDVFFLRRHQRHQMVFCPSLLNALERVSHSNVKAIARKLCVWSFSWDDHLRPRHIDGSPKSLQGSSMACEKLKKDPIQPQHVVNFSFWCTRCPCLQTFCYDSLSMPRSLRRQAQEKDHLPYTARGGGFDIALISFVRK